jgi:(p)ppGpp synthase/HD superfamily hydrolase
MVDGKDYRLLLEAVSFAARAHQGHLRKDRQTPYAAHPFRVCLVLRDVFKIEDRKILIAALLHDTIEDTQTDYDDLSEKFGADVAAWVGALSKDKREPEGEREVAYRAQLARSPWQVKVCKLADIFDNLMDLSNLPQEKRARALGNFETYLEALAAKPTEELRRPLALVTKLLEEMRANA